MSDIINSLFVNSNKPLDEKWGPYKDIDECLKILISETKNEILGETLSGVRYQGLTVGIIQENGTIKEYWFYEGIEDDHLVEKIIQPTDDNKGLPDGIYLLSFNSNESEGYMNSLLTNTKGKLKLPECEFTKENSSFKGWKFENDEHIYESNELVTLTNNSEINAIWDTLYWLIVNPSDDTPYGSVSGGGQYNSGKTVTITATPNNGYSFVKWSDGITTNPRNIEIENSNITLTAKFKIKQYTITVQSNNDKYGTVYVGEEEGKYSYIGNYNTEISINANPNDGYSFVQWNDKNTNKSRNIKITSDKEFIGTFEQNWYIIDGYYSTVDDIDNNNLTTCVFNNNNFEIKPNNTGDFQTEIGNFIIFLPLNMSLSGEYTALSSTTEITIVDDNLPDIDNATKVYTKLNDINTYKINNIDYNMYIFKCGSNAFDKYTIKINEKQQ